jgi:hypothetical protein
MSFSTSPRPRIFSRTAFNLSPGVLITTGLAALPGQIRETRTSRAMANASRASLASLAPGMEHLKLGW